LTQDDPLLEDFLIRNNYLTLTRGEQYHLDFPPESYPPDLIAEDIIKRVYKGSVPTPGFFLEVGSSNGQDNSPTIDFELRYKWNGLLIEPHPASFANSLNTNRKAYHVNTCVTGAKTPEYQMFNMSTRRLVGSSIQTGFEIELQCIPLYALLKAAGNPKVDLFVLDIGFGEADVLESIPWDKVRIDVILVHYHSSISQITPKERIVAVLSREKYWRVVTYGGEDQKMLFVSDQLYREKNPPNTTSSTSKMRLS